MQNSPINDSRPLSVRSNTGALTDEQKYGRGLRGKKACIKTTKKIYTALIYEDLPIIEDVDITGIMPRLVDKHPSLKKNGVLQTYLTKGLRGNQLIIAYLPHPSITPTEIEEMVRHYIKKESTT